MLILIDVIFVMASPPASLSHMLFISILYAYPVIESLAFQKVYSYNPVTRNRYLSISERLSVGEQRPY